MFLWVNGKPPHRLETNGHQFGPVKPCEFQAGCNRSWLEATPETLLGRVSLFKAAVFGGFKARPPAKSLVFVLFSVGGRSLKREATSFSHVSERLRLPSRRSSGCSCRASPRFLRRALKLSPELNLLCTTGYALRLRGTAK